MERFAKHLGGPPVELLLSKLKVYRFPRLHMELGMQPCNLLLYIHNACKLLNLPSVTGMAHVNSLCPRSKLIKLLKVAYLIRDRASKHAMINMEYLKRSREVS